MRFRQSEITAFQRCRRKWHFRYDLGIVPAPAGPRRPLSSHRDTGTTVHRGVEVYNDTGDIEQAVAAVYEKVDELRSIRLEGDLPELDTDSEWFEVARLSEAMTRNYAEWIAEGNEVGVVFHDTEKEWDVTIPGTDYTVWGTIDAILFDPAIQGDVVRDYKSVTSFSQTPQEVDFQLRTYAWAWWRITGNIPKRSEHLMMKRNLGGPRAKRPLFERFPVPITERALQAHEQHLMVRCAEIDEHRGLLAGDAHLFPNPTKDCSWDCDYREICPMVDDGSDWESVVEFEFVSTDDTD